MIYISDCGLLLRRHAATLAVLIAVLFLVSAASAVDLDFNVASGNYNVAGNWVDQTGVPPASPPAYVDATTNDNAYVRNNGTVVINSDVSNRLFRIGATSVLTPGDFNGNGIVDAADYALWRVGGTLQNDPTPGVQPEDYAYWRSHFGQTTSPQVGQGTLNWTAGKITAETGPPPTAAATYYGPDIRVGQRDNATGTNFTGTVTQNGESTELLLLHSTSRLNIGDGGTTTNPVSTYNLVNGTIGLVNSYSNINGGALEGSNGNNGINVRNGIFNMSGGKIIDKTAEIAPPEGGNTLSTDQRFLTISTTSGGVGTENVARANFSGGTVDVLGGLRVATSSNSRGFLNINGPVVWNLGGEVSVGYNVTNGVGEMNMSDGQINIGTSTVTRAFQIGHRGHGTLNLSGGSINVSGELRVGAQIESQNSLINMTGGNLTTKTLNIQRQAGGGQPAIIIDGPNANFVQGPNGGTDQATMGQNGAALFEVRQGQATLHQVQLGNSILSAPTLNVKGGKLKITGPVLKTDPNSPTPVLGLTGGTIEITPKVAGTVQWQTSFTNAGSKIVLNPNTLQQITMSTTAGSASISNFAMSSGSWDLEIGSNVTASGADRFIVNGTGIGAISLTGGTLNISRINGYLPSVNDTLTILQGNGGVTLNAGAVTLAGDPGWSLISNSAQIQLKYVGPGAGAGVGLNSPTVPEPSSIALLVFAVAGLVAAKRTRFPTTAQQ